MGHFCYTNFSVPDPPPPSPPTPFKHSPAQSCSPCPGRPRKITLLPPVLLALCPRCLHCTPPLRPHTQAPSVPSQSPPVLVRAEASYKSHRLKLGCHSDRLWSRAGWGFEEQEALTLRTGALAGMRWRGGGGHRPRPSRALSLCPATVSRTPSGSFNGTCNRQYPPPPGNLLQPPIQPLLEPPLKSPPF